MPLVLKLMLVDTVSGAHGECRVELRDDAVKLTRHSFLNEYCGPCVATAWDAMRQDHERRQFETVKQNGNIVATQ
jgi:hypothetical protein